MKQHYVTFLSPGTLVAESTRKEIDEWSITKAIALLEGVKERHGALPYGFYFSTRERQDDELDAKQTERSGTYFLGGLIRTIEEVERNNKPGEQILLSNMKCNGYDRVITNCNSYSWTQPLTDKDTVLEWGHGDTP